MVVGMGIREFLGGFFVEDRQRRGGDGVPYVKGFDGWNEVKKGIGRRRVPFVRVREIWWCLWGVNADCELDGKGRRFVRPVLVFRKRDDGRKLFVIPLTGRVDEGNSGYYKYDKGSLAFGDAKNISAKRLLGFKGRVNRYNFGEVQKAYAKYMGFGDNK